MKTQMSLSGLLAKYGACPGAVEWAKGRKVSAASWRECERGDWMLWIAAKIDVDRKLLVRAACVCARQALKYVRTGEDRPRIAIETAERWCDGLATIEEVRIARSGAADAAAYAADAAAYAAYAYDAADAAAGKMSLKRSASYVRGVIPWSVIAERLKEIA